MPAAVRSIPSSDLTAIEVSGRIVGEGGLTIAATGQDEDGETKVILSNDNTYTGGTTITGGRVQIGRGGTSGSIVGDVVNHGVLVFRPIRYPNILGPHLRFRVVSCTAAPAP